MWVSYRFHCSSRYRLFRSMGVHAKLIHHGRGSNTFCLEYHIRCRIRCVLPYSIAPRAFADRSQTTVEGTVAIAQFTMGNYEVTSQGTQDDILSRGTIISYFNRSVYQCFHGNSDSPVYSRYDNSYLTLSPDRSHSYRTFILRITYTVF